MSSEQPSALLRASLAELRLTQIPHISLKLWDLMAISRWSFKTTRQVPRYRTWVCFQEHQGIREVASRFQHSACMYVYVLVCV